MMMMILGNRVELRTADSTQLACRKEYLPCMSLQTQRGCMHSISSTALIQACLCNSVKVLLSNMISSREEQCLRRSRTLHQ